MSVNSYLETLASSLVLNSTEKNHITTSISTIKTRLNNYFSEIKDAIIFGSYSRDTILPRKADEKSDVDIMVIFDNPNFISHKVLLINLRRLLIIIIKLRKYINLIQYISPISHILFGHIFCRYSFHHKNLNMYNDVLLRPKDQNNQYSRSFQNCYQ